jgi:hypothetical protein
MYWLREELRIIMLRLLTLVAVTVGVAVATVAPSSSRADGTPDYTPDPASLRQHQVPKWFDDAKLGFFIHWTGAARRTARWTATSTARSSTAR